jgi:hypothetical protein
MNAPNTLPEGKREQPALTNSTWSDLSWADAAPAPNAIIAAMTSATVTTNNKRLIMRYLLYPQPPRVKGCSVLYKEDDGTPL